MQRKGNESEEKESSRGTRIKVKMFLSELFIFSFLLFSKIFVCVEKGDNAVGG